MSSAQIQARIKAGLKRAQLKTGSTTSDKAYLVTETTTGGTPLNPAVTTSINVELPNAIFINYDAGHFNSNILSGDRKLICGNASIIKQGDVIIQGAVKYYVVSNEPIAPTSDVLAYMPQLRVK